MTETPAMKLNGAYALAFACEDRALRASQLARLGFEDITTGSGRRDQVTMLRWGNIQVYLVDPQSRYQPVLVGPCLESYGDMQLHVVGIAIDDLDECVDAFGGYTYSVTRPDPFGIQCYARISPKNIAPVWRFTEAPLLRTVSGEPTIDHFAVAVPDLSAARTFYQKKGFQVVYDPKQPIAGDFSAMETVALSYGDPKGWKWTIALVKGVDQQQPSQVTNYLEAHGAHAVQHVAVRCTDLAELMEELWHRGVRFRARVDQPSKEFVLEDYLHLGRDHSGPLKQCFTKPFTPGGFFFELIERMTEEQYETTRAGFDTKTVIGLYRSIEREERSSDTALITDEDATT